MFNQLPEPFKDWTIDENGTIHTRSGYKCSPELIEAALWLFGISSVKDRTKLMFAIDDTEGKKRPLYEISDLRIPKRGDIHVERTVGLQPPTDSPQIDFAGWQRWEAESER